MLVPCGQLVVSGIFQLDIAKIIGDVVLVQPCSRLLAGGALGIGIALIIVWILFMIVTLMYTTAVGKEIYEMVQNNSILKLIYDCNPIMRLAVKSVLRFLVTISQKFFS